MANRKRHDDRPLLEIIAEFMAWPNDSNIRSFEEAMRRAVSLESASKFWTEEKVNYTYQRLRKSYQKVGPSLVAKSKEKGKYVSPQPGTFFDSIDPDLRFEIQERNVRQSVYNLKMASEWLSTLADLMEKQWATRSVNPDLTRHAEALLHKIDGQMAADGVPALRTMTLRRMGRKSSQ